MHSNGPPTRLDLVCQLLGCPQFAQLSGSERQSVLVSDIANPYNSSVPVPPSRIIPDHFEDVDDFAGVRFRKHTRNAP
jgi:hypothetical protein